jgi:hypothetical protein
MANLMSRKRSDNSNLASPKRLRDGRELLAAEREAYWSRSDAGIR